MKFSQRIGKSPMKKLAQIDSIDNELRTSLWNAIVVNYINRSIDKRYYGYSIDSSIYPFFVKCWENNLIEPVDEIPQYFSDTVKYLKKYFFNSKWYKSLELIEDIVNYGSDEVKYEYLKNCNDYLIRENSAYRFVGNKLSQITSQVEIDAVENAMSITTDTYGGVNEHLDRALILMSDKISPDYRNSIKESISAVESLAKKLSSKEKATLGEALNALESKGIKLHGALKASFQSLYGYTSDAEGIRHALLDESNLSVDDAKYMLVSCSSFVNYLIALDDD